MKLKKTNIDLLYQIAEDIANPVRCYRLAAGVFYKNGVVGLGINSYKSDPLQAKYAKNEDAIYLHAEVAAIKNALRYVTVNDLRKCTLAVVRVKKDNLTGLFRPAMSKPCSGCQSCIAAFEIPTVVYTTEEGLLVQNG